MPDALTPVAQHLAVWDVARDTGWVALYGSDGEALTREEIESPDDFGLIVRLLTEREGLRFDRRRRVIRRVVATDGGMG